MMNQISLIFPIIVIAYSIYFLGKFSAAIAFGIYEKHLFLGFGKRPFFTFSVKEAKVSIGLFIPFPWLARYYRIVEGRKIPVRYEWEHRQKSFFARLALIYSGSVSMLISSILLFTFITFTNVDSYISKDELNIHGIYPLELGRKIGLEKGDKVIAVNGGDYQRFTDLMSPKLLLQDDSYYTVIRKSDTLVVEIPANFLEEFLTRDNPGFITFNTPFEVAKVLPESTAEASGLIPGDIPLEVEGEDIHNFQEFKEIISKHLGDSASLLVDRNGSHVHLNIFVPLEGEIGFVSQPLINYSIKSKGIFESLIIGIKRPFLLIKSNILAFIRIMTDEMVPPKGISSISKNDSFFLLTTLAISLTLYALYDILPIPKSSTLRAIPLFWEKMFQTKVSVNAFRRIQKSMWALLLVFLLWIVINDILNF